MPRRAASIDEYIAGSAPAARPMLEEMRAAIKATAPDATETISYGIPTFDLNGRHLVHVAGYSRHVGMYPAPVDHPEFAADLAPYRSGRATARFPLGRPLPADLVRRIVAFRAGESERKVRG